VNTQSPITFSAAAIKLHQEAMDIYEKQMVPGSLRFGECYDDFARTLDIQRDLRSGFLDHSSRVKAIAYSFQMKPPLEIEGRDKVHQYVNAVFHEFKLKPERAIILTAKEPYTFIFQFAKEDYTLVKSMLEWWFPTATPAAAIAEAKTGVTKKAPAAGKSSAVRSRGKTVRAQPSRVKRAEA
jgi:hypothetical protein